ncbi:MAG: F0F1 ATP synthase subunit B [Chloroflexi bacterium]|nr:F0F1 ATP synthase subunit B [Chloroflexota bacterium]
MGELLSSMGINPPLLIAQLINFTLLFILIYMFGFKRIGAMLDERSRRIKEGLDKAEQIRQQAAEADKAFRAQMDTARKEAQAVIGQASQMAERVKEEAREEARKEVESRIARAQNEIQRQRDETLEALRREFADIAILAAEKVIRERLDKEANKKIIEQVLAETGALKKT